MSLSRGQLDQMEAAAIHRQEDKEHLLLEQEIMGKWARGELVEVVRCKNCKNRIDGICRIFTAVAHPDYYCAFGDRKQPRQRKEKTDAEIH